MAIQAQMYPENLGLPLGGGAGGGSQDWLMDINNNNLGNINNNSNNLVLNGCGLNELSFNLLQKQQQQQQIPYQQQQQLQQQYLVQFHNLHQGNQNQNQSFPSENGFLFLPSSKNCNNTCTTSTNTISTTASSDYMSMNLSQSLAAQLEKQRQEIDRYITLQNERLKLALQQQRKQQVATIVRKLESRASMLLKQKDEEIAKERNRTMELEESVRKMEAESQGWQRVAAEKEAMVSSLNNSLQQLREQQQACSANGVDDAESCCDDNDNRNRVVVGGNNDDEQQAQEMGNKGFMMMMMVCKICNARNSCMLLLPCRHLCSCKACDPFIRACPLCRSPKTASIEALFS